MNSINNLKKALEDNSAPMDYKYALSQVDKIEIDSDIILNLMNDLDVDKLHRGDPCYYCGEYHDNVKTGDCKGVKLIRTDNVIDKINVKMQGADLNDKNWTYWYKCGLHDAIDIIKSEQEVSVTKL